MEGDSRKNGEVCFLLPDDPEEHLPCSPGFHHFSRESTQSTEYYNEG